MRASWPALDRMWTGTFPARDAPDRPDSRLQHRGVELGQLVERPPGRRQLLHVCNIRQSIMLRDGHQPESRETADANLCAYHCLERAVREAHSPGVRAAPGRHLADYGRSPAGRRAGDRADGR